MKLVGYAWDKEGFWLALIRVSETGHIEATEGDLRRWRDGASGADRPFYSDALSNGPWRREPTPEERKSGAQLVVEAEGHIEE